MTDENTEAVGDLCRLAAEQKNRGNATRAAVLYCAADELTRLRAKLTQVEAERDRLLGEVERLRRHPPSQAQQIRALLDSATRCPCCSSSQWTPGNECPECAYAEKNS